MGRGYSGNHPRYSGERYDAKQAYNKDLTASARLHYLENDRHDHDSPHHMSVNQRLEDSFGMGQNTGSAPSPMNNRADRLRERAGKISSETQGQGGYDYENPKVQKLLSKATKVEERSGMKSRDERSGELRGREVDDMIDNRPDSPFNQNALTMDALEGYEGSLSRINKPMRGLDFGPDRETRQVVDDRTGETYAVPVITPSEYDYKSLDYLGSNPEARLKKFAKISPYTGKSVLGEGEGYAFGQKGNIEKHIQSERAKEMPKKVLKTELEMLKDRVEDIQNSPLNACAKDEGGSGCIKEMGGAWRVISNKTDKPWPAKYASKSKAEAALRGYHAG
tara:strand:- start:388 stop:1395 length:1008 start_codon:yes stop_codon:yes gene_type:complete